jgi:hypothetical protein
VKSDENSRTRTTTRSATKILQSKTDNLGLILISDDVAVAEIKKWNGLRGNISLMEKFKNHYYRNRGSNRKKKS